MLGIAVLSMSVDNDYTTTECLRYGTHTFHPYARQAGWTLMLRPRWPDRATKGTVIDDAERADGHSRLHSPHGGTMESRYRRRAPDGVAEAARGEPTTEFDRASAKGRPPCYH